MRTTGFTMALLLLALPLGALAQECREQLAAVAQLARETPRVDLERRQINRLREVALYLASTRREAACLELVGAIEGIVRERRDVLERTDEIVRFAAAPPLADLKHPISAGELIGSVVRGPTGEEVGEIRDLVLRPDGTVAYVAVHHGSFIGLGGRSVAVDWDSLRRTQDGATYVLQATEDDLEQVPELDRDGGWPAEPPGMLGGAPSPAGR